MTYENCRPADAEWATAQILNLYRSYLSFISPPAKEKPVTWKDTPTHDHDDVLLCTACNAPPAKEEAPMPPTNTVCLRDDPENKRFLLASQEGKIYPCRGVLLWHGTEVNVGAIGVDDVGPLLAATYGVKTHDLSAEAFAFEAEHPLRAVIAGLEERNSNQFDQIMELRTEVDDLKGEVRRLLDDNNALSAALAETVEVESKVVDLEIEVKGHEPILVSTLKNVETTDDGEPISVSYIVDGATLTATYYEVRK